MESERRAIVLAAGLGTRLRPVTDIFPKCMVPVRGRPLLEYWLRALSGAGFGKCVVNTHYKADLFREYLAGFPGDLDITISHEEQLLGTGGTLLNNREFCQGGPVMLIHADNLCLTDLGAFWEAHARRPRNTAITMMTFQTPTPKTCGIVELDEDGVVQAFHEKVENPPGDLANGAVYIVEPEVVEFIAGLGKPEVDFSTEVLPRFVGRIFTHHNGDYHRDIGNPESLLAAHEDSWTFSPEQVDPDNWSRLCRGQLASELRGFPEALARSIGARQVEFERIAASAGDGKRDRDATILTVLPSSTDNVDAVAGEVRALFPEAKRIVLVSRFSASRDVPHAIYNAHRVTWYQICSQNI
ncbi:nucleotidyltransferase family protein [Pseudodesulfovibrio karagichevae]|uniref:Nucleotidyltransferase family protein n=1 Tax=Pseudodesulfovibrio karagichevae TaxID=3239305 RepID=A0ABV4JZ22_9BACT